MASSILKRSWTTFHDATQVYISAKFAISFGKKSVDIWRIDPPSLSYVAPLSHFLEYPGARRVAADPARDILIVENNACVPPSLWVYSLTDGTRTRTVDMYGETLGSPLRYSKGHAIMTVREDADTAPPDGLDTILHCDVAGDGWLLGALTRPGAGALVPALLSSTGDMFATTSAPFVGTLSLLRWEGPTFEDEQVPTESLEISVSLEDGDTVEPACSAPLGDDGLLLAAYETVADALEDKFGAQTAIHAFDCTPLRTRWRAEPVWGRVYSVRYVVSQALVVGIGKRDMREGAGEFDWTTFVVVLDAHTGALRRLDDINHRAQGSDVHRCALSHEEDDPAVVVVLKNGDVSVTPLTAFVAGGFTRSEGRLHVNKVLPQDSVVTGADVGERVLLVVASEVVDSVEASSKIWCFVW